MEPIVLILNGFEAAAFITGFVYWNKLRGTYWKYFPVYLLGIFICEMIGKYMKLHGLKEYNMLFCNYFVINLEFLFFYWLFYRSYAQLKNKRIAIASISLYIIGLLADISYIHKFEYWFASFTYTLGVALMLILIALYFIQLAMSEDAILQIKTNILFWICIGLLFFYIGTFPFYGIRNTLWLNYKSVAKTYSYFAFALNYFMYFMFSFSIICGKPKT